MSRQPAPVGVYFTDNTLIWCKMPDKSRKLGYCWFDVINGNNVGSISANQEILDSYKIVNVKLISILYSK